MSIPRSRRAMNGAKGQSAEPGLRARTRGGAVPNRHRTVCNCVQMCYLNGKPQGWPVRAICSAGFFAVYRQMNKEAMQ